MISADHGRRVFCLQVAGLQHRYHSINPPSSSNLASNITTGIAYTDTEAILSVGSFNSSIDVAGGLASYSPISIELAIKRDGSDSDPGVVFGRVGKRASVFKTNLESNIDFSSLPITVNVEDDLSGLSTPRLFHVGGETFRASAISTSTITLSDRAVGGSPFQAHEISLQGSSIPLATSEITIFRGRRAKLYIASLDKSGNVSDYTEIINGFIESSPYYESSSTVSLNILPLVSMIDGTLADTKSGISYLLQGYHYYHNNRSNVFEFGSAFKKDYEIIISDTDELNPNTTFVYISRPDYNLADIYDEGRNKGVFYTNSHPRYPLMTVASQGKVYPSTLGPNRASNGRFYFVLDHTVPGSMDQTAFRILTSGTGKIRIPNRGEIKRYTLGSNELKRFPDVVNEVLDAEGPTTHTGFSGAFHTLRINGDRVVGVPLADQRGDHEGRIHLWYSAEWYRNSTYYNYAYWPSIFIEIPATPENYFGNEKRVFYPFDWWNDQDNPKPNYAGNSMKVKTIEFPNRRSQSVIFDANIAKAYHQANEPSILVESSLGLPTAPVAGEYYGIQVDTYDYFQKKRKVLYYRASHEVEMRFPAGTGPVVGYRIIIPLFRDNTSNGHFGDWDGQDRTQVMRGVLADNISPGEMMLQILQSGGGGNNGAYDKLGVGLSIHEDDIDVNSFLINGTSLGLGVDTAFSIDDFNCREFIDSLLKSIACIISMRRSGGRSKITLQPIGNEHEDNVQATLFNNDLMADPAPHFSIYEDIVTQVKINYGWNNDENEFKDKVTFNNQDAINRYGGEKSAITIDLYGLNSVDVGSGAGDAYNYLLPIASRIFNTMSNPCITWKMSIGTGKSMFLDIGSYVKVTSPHLKSYSDSFGITDEIGMITSINQNLMSEGCELEILHTGISVSNWNSTLRVTFITSTTAITVASNCYSDDDLSFFQEGDRVDFLPFGDEDNAITNLKIISIVGTLITFASVHNITTLGTIEPTQFSLASDDHKIDAYLSDGNVLGTEDAKEYA